MPDNQTMIMVVVIGFLLMIAIRYFKRRGTTLPIDLNGDGKPDQVSDLLESVKDELDANKLGLFKSIIKAAFARDWQSVTTHGRELATVLKQSRDDSPQSVMDNQFYFELDKRLKQDSGYEKISKRLKTEFQRRKASIGDLSENPLTPTESK